MDQQPATQDGDGGTLQTVSQRDVRLLYAADFWDYPHSGALLWRGRRYWFSEAEPDSGVFDIIELTDDAWAVEDARHADFRRFVGTHFDVDESGTAGQVHPAELHSRYYDKWLDVPELDSRSGRVVARWRFEDAPWPAGKGTEG